MKMITESQARDLLVASMTDLISKNGMQFTTRDLLAEINIVAVKYILDNYSPQNDANPMTYLSTNTQKYGEIARTFAVALYDQYSTVLTPSVVNDLVNNICQGISINGVRKVISDYMRDRHGVEDSSDGESYDFMSSRHERYQFGSFVEASEVQRLIHINASIDWKRISVHITPTLTTKEAYLEKKEGKKLYYTGADPDFQFIVELDDFEEITFFSLIRRDKHLRLDYYE